MSQLIKSIYQNTFDKICREQKNVTMMRDSNIELLRILAVAGVILLHFNGIYGNALTYVKSGTVNDYVLRYLESVFIPAVNLFILISGYNLSGTYKRSLVKPVRLIVQVIIFNEAIYFISVVMDGAVFSLKTMFDYMWPCNYYVILYTVLYLISPYINIVMERLKEQQLKIFIGMSFVLFSVWATTVDVLQEVLGRELMGLNPVGMYGDSNGYTIVNFVLMYTIGAYIKIKNVQWSTKKSLVVMVLCSIILTIWSIVLPNTAWSYCNPLVILQAGAVFFLCKKMQFSNKFINILSKATFSCFLFHGFFVKRIPTSVITESNVLVMLACIIILMIVIYFMCWCVWWVYSLFEKYVLQKIFRVLDKMVINVEP